MTYKKFVLWIEKNTPDGVEPDDFIEYLASSTAELIELGAKRAEMKTSDYVLKLLESNLETFYTH